MPSTQPTGDDTEVEFTTLATTEPTSAALGADESTSSPKPSDWPSNPATHDLETGGQYGLVNCLCGGPSPNPSTPPSSSLATIAAWLRLNKSQLLSGVTVSLAQVPEAVAFALVAGVKPIVGLHAAWIMGCMTGIFGGRPGMIAGATGAVAVVMISLVADEGVEYLFYAVMLAGIFQMAFGKLGGGALVRMIPHPVMVGFVNGLGLVIGLAQFNSFKVASDDSDGAHRRHLAETVPGVVGRRLSGGAFAPFTNGEEWVDGTTGVWMAVHVLTAMCVTLFLPKLTKAFPSALAGILTPTIVEWALVRPLGFSTNVIEDVSSVAGSFPIPVWFDSDYDMPAPTPEVFGKVWVTAVLVACIGMLEAQMTLSLIDDMTGTKGNRNQECIGQGVGNFFSGAFGAMGGCTTIGQSIMNIHNGGTTRLSAVSASVFMLLIILVAYPVINKIPTSALVGVMFVICYHTIEWSSIRVLVSSSLPLKWRTHAKVNSEAKVNRSDAFVVIIVMAVTLYMDLAVAVVVGIIVSSLIFSWNSGATLTVERSVQKIDDGEEMCTYEVSGSLFFASIQPFMESFTERDDPKHVRVNFDNCDIYDWSAIEAINALNAKYDDLDKKVQFKQIKLSSRKIMAKARLLLKEQVSVATFVEGEDIVVGKPNKIGSGFVTRDSKSD